jgi:hypothetical protein
MFERHIGIFRRDACDRAAPQTRGFQHIGFVYRGDMLAALARQLEGATRHALDFGNGVLALIGGGVGCTCLCTEVRTTGQLAHKQHVDVLQLFVLQG